MRCEPDELVLVSSSSPLDKYATSLRERQRERERERDEQRVCAYVCVCVRKRESNLSQHPAIKREIFDGVFENVARPPSPASLLHTQQLHQHPVHCITVCVCVCVCVCACVCEASLVH